MIYFSWWRKVFENFLSLNQTTKLLSQKLTKNHVRTSYFFINFNITMVVIYTEFYVGNNSKCNFFFFFLTSKKYGKIPYKLTSLYIHSHQLSFEAVEIIILKKDENFSCFRTLLGCDCCSPNYEETWGKAKPANNQSSRWVLKNILFLFDLVFLSFLSETRS